MSECSVTGCDRPADGYLCATHKKRAQRGRPLTAPVVGKLKPWDRMLEAFMQLFDVDSEDDAAFERAQARARMAALRWARSGCLAPAVETLTNSVLEAVQTPARGEPGTKRRARG